MRIVIDLQGAQSESRFRGIGRYSLSLSQAIAKNRGSHEVLIVLNGSFSESADMIIKAFDGLLPKESILIWHATTPVTYLDHDNNWRRKSAEVLRESFLAGLQPDVLLISSLVEGAKDDTVVSIGKIKSDYHKAAILYDLIPLVYRNEYLKNNDVREWYMEKVGFFQKTDLCLAISDFTRKTAIEQLDLEDSRVVNIFAAIESNFGDQEVTDEFLEKLIAKHKIKKKYILYCGAADPRKNLKRLIKAHSILSVPLRQNHQLVIAGTMSVLERSELEIYAKSVGLNADEIVLTGRVHDKELVALYKNCELFVLPSYHEGFGLPLLEAMACGAPAIGSNISSIPEVIGNDSALFDPFSVTEIASKIEEVLRDTEFRSRLVESGRNRVRCFSWDRAAKTAIAAFESLKGEKTRKGFYGSSEKLYDETLKSIQSISEPHKPIPDNEILDLAKALDNNLFSLKRMNNYERDEIQSWRIEGPFDSSYSLCLLNRETARALQKMGFFVVLHSTEGPGDFNPNERFLEENPDLQKMYCCSNTSAHSSVDVVSRNLYPPRVDDMHGVLNLLHHYAWEESAFPFDWVENFNEHLDGITCLSSHVEKILIDNGVSIPLITSGCGVDHWERIQHDKGFSIEAKNFRFLHVSSCFPRKGIELLLEAFGDSFSSNDDVTLIIKTFKNPHNTVHDILADFEKSNSLFPHVLILEDDLTDSKLKALYMLSDVMVAPSYAEGFGLPLAEAMLSEVPVITTSWGGQLDFCNDENSWLIDYTFEEAQTHFNLHNSVWAKCNVTDLAEAMKSCFLQGEEVLKSKALKGRSFILNYCTWENVTKKLVRFASELKLSSQIAEANVGWMTTWNTKCGIAEYSKYLLGEKWKEEVTILAPTLKDEVLEEENCLRCWQESKDHNGLEDVFTIVRKKNINVLIIQFNYGFFNFGEFSQFLHKLIRIGCSIIVEIHSTSDPEHAEKNPNNRLSELYSCLKMCDRLLVHSVKDLNRLKDLNLIDNVTLFPHGILDVESSVYSDIEPNSPMIATFGFCLPHKGLLELLEAVYILHQKNLHIKLRLLNAEYPIPESSILIRSIKEKIGDYGLEDYVEFETDFLDKETVVKKLAEADIVVFPYSQTGESASGAVRLGLISRRPVVVTPLDIFSDLGDAVVRLAGTNPEVIAEGVSNTLTDLKQQSEYICNIQKNASSWIESNTYSKLRKRLRGMCQALSRRKHLGV